jgi:hypothetical protein
MIKIESFIYLLLLLFTNMVNSKKYKDSNPRVVISTRLDVKKWLRQNIEGNTDHKRLTKLIQKVVKNEHN